jgi:endonuclease YncB( thermonuclease family)
LAASSLQPTTTPVSTPPIQTVTTGENLQQNTQKIFWGGKDFGAMLVERGYARTYIEGEFKKEIKRQVNAIGQIKKVSLSNTPRLRSI